MVEETLSQLNFVFLNIFFSKKGVYRRSEALELFIDVHDVVELRSHSLTNTLVIGGNVSLNETIQILTEASKKSGFEYCQHLAKHVAMVANYPVRDVSLQLQHYYTYGR